MRFVDKNIAVLGLGQEGKDVLAWLQANAPETKVTTFDKVTSVDLTPFDVIFRSPGFYRLSDMIKAAQAKGAEITSATKLFFELCPAKIIGVTGTKGKGTTTTLIYEMLKTQGLTAYIAGNIGNPMLELLPSLTPQDWVCLELSSFQLQDLTASPHLSVVLNVTSEHLDVHKDTEEYREAKTNIVKYQTAEDFAVINSDYDTTKSFAKLTKAKVVYFSKDKLGIDKTKVKLRGEHNLENIAAAESAARLAEVSQENIEMVAYSFTGLEHRLEPVRQVDGVTYFNDSFSTTPETAIAAIKSFSEPMTIILGGSDKGSDYTQLGKVICQSKNIANLILIGKMAGKIKAAIGKTDIPLIEGLNSIDDIVSKAKEVSRPGEVVVLSPACASFDMFLNYKDRGEKFKQAVTAL
jgi:UDP-N-acetylmuramoylalanine--D-glutamate ligase